MGPCAHGPMCPWAFGLMESMGPGSIGPRPFIWGCRGSITPWSGPGPTDPRAGFGLKRSIAWFRYCVWVFDGVQILSKNKVADTWVVVLGPWYVPTSLVRPISIILCVVHASPYFCVYPYIQFLSRFISECPHVFRRRARGSGREDHGPMGP